MSEVIPKPFWHRSTFLIVTGASQGIGRNLAIEFSRFLDSKSVILLIARSQPNLEETKRKILEVNSALDIKVHPVDLSKPDSQLYRNLFQSNVGKRRYELYLLVHNAASLIIDTPASKMEDVHLLENYMSLNLYSVTVLTSVFLDLFREGERCIVNISSLLGIQAVKGAVFYCIGKASREMYFKVLALENPSLNILNYAPGPIETDMFMKTANECCDPETRSLFQEMVAKKSAVKMEDTLQKLIDILRRRCYQSGGRIDFYDEV